jgi:hypothetical protein
MASNNSGSGNNPLEQELAVCGVSRNTANRAFLVAMAIVQGKKIPSRAAVACMSLSDADIKLTCERANTFITNKCAYLLTIRPQDQHVQRLRDNWNLIAADIQANALCTDDDELQNLYYNALLDTEQVATWVRETGTA